MDKSADAFRTISEVADSLDVPQHVLRFWETRFSQIKPMKRTGGRRYYRPDDVDLLRGIRHLLYGQGYTIRGVQRILREHGVKAVQQLAEGAAMPGARFVSQAGAGQERDSDDFDHDVDVTTDDVEFDQDEGDPHGAPPHVAPPRMAAPRIEPAMPASPFIPTDPSLRREPTMQAPSVAAAPKSVAPPAHSIPVAPGAQPMRADNARKLQATLQELVECKRLLNEKLEKSAT